MGCWEERTGIGHFGQYSGRYVAAQLQPKVSTIPTRVVLICSITLDNWEKAISYHQHQAYEGPEDSSQDQHRSKQRRAARAVKNAKKRISQGDVGARVE